MHHNVYVQAEQHKKAEPPLRSPPLLHRHSPNWPVRQPSSQAGDYDSDPKAAACLLCSLFQESAAHSEPV